MAAATTSDSALFNRACMHAPDRPALRGTSPEKTKGPVMLQLNIQREVKPSEVTSLVFGTGALTMPWWQNVQWMRPYESGHEELHPRDHALDEAMDLDYFVMIVDDPDEAEGSGKTRRVELTMQQLVDAAGVAIRKGYVYDSDAVKDDLGYCDALQADVVMQLATFEVEEPVYG